MNPVNSEQHMHYIHLLIKEQHCSGECLHRRLCHNHLMHMPFALGLQSTHLLRCLLLPVWVDCLLSVAMSKLLHICIHLLLNYTQNVGSPYTCPNTLYRKVIPRQVATLLKSIIKTLSKCDWYKRPHPSHRYMCTHCTSCQSVPLVGVGCNDMHSRCLT